ncbi:MAG TPA: hypothetical protein VGR78_13020, partial [Verrucomicrobiae bacterium]|nr:hypothetical protein [Verrucomicrobiae bacterium]
MAETFEPFYDWRVEPRLMIKGITALCALLCCAFFQTLCAQTTPSSGGVFTNDATARTSPSPKQTSSPRSRSSATNAPSLGAATNVSYKIPVARIIEFPVPLTPAATVAVANSKNPMAAFARA